MMGTACKDTRDRVAENPIELEYASRYMVVQAWSIATALYNGIEQALKMLLLAPSDSAFTLEDLRKRKYGHNLKKLYTALPTDDREHIERHFREHWSLHEYDTRGLSLDTAESFIAHINSGGPQGGLISWRYVLLEGAAQIPAMSLWTMSEIWDAICCRIRTKALGKQDDCWRLSHRLDMRFDDITNEPIDAYDDYFDDLERWANHKDGDLLAAWVDLLVKASRDDMHLVEVPERLRPELARMASRIIDHMSGDSADPDEARLLRRVKQTDRDLVWDPNKGEFRRHPLS